MAKVSCSPSFTKVLKAKKIFVASLPFKNLTCSHIHMLVKISLVAAYTEARVSYSYQTNVIISQKSRALTISHKHYKPTIRHGDHSHQSHHLPTGA
jgi:hypothetical protein